VAGRQRAGWQGLGSCLLLDHRLPRSILGRCRVSAKRLREIVRQFDDDPSRRCRVSLLGKAEIRATQLLKQNLSAAQREQYEQRGYFEVKGGTTGRRYRIRRGVQMNVEHLDPSGRCLRLLCFMPEGHLAVGDVMLAQKFALELFEKEALQIANKARTLDFFLVLDAAPGAYEARALMPCPTPCSWCGGIAFETVDGLRSSSQSRSIVVVSVGPTLYADRVDHPPVKWIAHARRCLPVGLLPSECNGRRPAC
jgi:hypothetical protein